MDSPDPSSPAPGGGLRTITLLGAGAACLAWPSLRADKPSAWFGHVSFAHWLVGATAPRCIVELGTHNGVSYAAFCNAVQRLGLPAQCHAVDTWQGDEHAGHYGEDVFEDVARFNAERFPAISTMHRCTFDAALPWFGDGSVDILHIDGLHTYEAVKHDFDTWLPKLSRRGVVLFHDTEIRHADFGVWQLWAELSSRYPAFNFLHSAGLGVLAVGSDVPGALAALCQEALTAKGTALRLEFEVASGAAHQNGVLAQQAAPTPPPLRNAALGQVAMQSSSFQNSPPTASGAVNGNKTGGYGFHTALELEPWWMVDLGSRQPVQQIVIYNRLDGICPARARTLSVLVSPDAETWTVLYRHDGTPFGGADGSPLRVRGNGVAARFVRLKLEDVQYLHLDEVEVFV